MKTKDSKLFVFMSLVSPDEVWLSLSFELEKVGGIFVLKNLPNYNFKLLESKISKLKKKGVGAEIQINPLLYQTYHIKQTPTFVVVDTPYSYKISGNFSLKTALNLICEKDKNTLCADLRKKLCSDS